MQPPAPASLDSPFYYLENFLTALQWVMRQHAALLSPGELSRLAEFQQLPQEAQALLVRLLMRKGNLFRGDKLRYGEIDTLSAIRHLKAQNWLEQITAIEVEAYFALFTKAEAQQHLAQKFRASGLKCSATKRELKEALQNLCGETPLPSPKPVIAISSPQLFLKVRLLFFGNLHQDWSEFVLTELGHLRYESVSMPEGQSVFGDAKTVERFLQLSQLEEELLTTGAPEKLTAKLPRCCEAHFLTERLRNKILFLIGQQAQRLEQHELALDCYSHCNLTEAKLRQFRLKERFGPDPALFQQLSAALGSTPSRAEAEGYRRILKRLAKKLNLKPPQTAPSRQIPVFEAPLHSHDSPTIEGYAADYLATPETPVFYVENTLFNGLFALLFWPALFAPVPGAFFHPFQSRPADLYQKEFVCKRRNIIDNCLALLESNGYRQTMLQRWEQKRGISCHLINWQRLDGKRLSLALQCISPEALRAIFERMLENISDHCKGFPDLIQFYPQQGRFRLIEVKGPGDRLQPHQRYWLEYLLDHDIDVSVLNLKAADQADSFSAG
ncbi:VRR-NUC domain-containing protein [Marinobacterium jannaschii]|uniref:VRR-NUC domain-containing protein n=1 Tax=Marinobacterium jannaschii TaxID=64970 RepID=UPI0004831CBA